MTEPDGTDENPQSTRSEPSKGGMGAYRRTALVVAVLFIIGTAAYSASIVALSPVLDASDPLVEASESEGMVGLGALFVLTSGAACVSIPFVMFPLLRRRSESLALGYIVFRVLEVACYVVMAIVVLLLVTVGHDFVEAGAPEGSGHESSGEMLLGAYDWTTLVIAVVFSLGALIFYYLLYVTGLVPRWLSGWGLVGAALHLVGGALGILGSLTEADMAYMLLALPIGVNEMVLAVWLIVKGFDTSGIAPGPTGSGARGVG